MRRDALVVVAVAMLHHLLCGSASGASVGDVVERAGAAGNPNTTTAPEERSGKDKGIFKQVSPTTTKKLPSSDKPNVNGNGNNKNKTPPAKKPSNKGDSKEKPSLTNKGNAKVNEGSKISTGTVVNMHTESLKKPLEEGSEEESRPGNKENAKVNEDSTNAKGNKDNEPLRRPSGHGGSREVPSSVDVATQVDSNTTRADGGGHRVDVNLVTSLTYNTSSPDGGGGGGVYINTSSSSGGAEAGRYSHSVSYNTVGGDKKNEGRPKPITSDQGPSYAAFIPPMFQYPNNFWRPPVLDQHHNDDEGNAQTNTQQGHKTLPPFMQPPGAGAVGYEHNNDGTGWGAYVSPFYNQWADMQHNGGGFYLPGAGVMAPLFGGGGGGNYDDHQEPHGAFLRIGGIPRWIRSVHLNR